MRHRNFRLFFAGQSISLVGNWMTRLATSWLVYDLTHSALLLGVAGFAGQIATFVLAPFAGAWIENRDRRRLLVWTQSAAALQSLALAALVLARVVTYHEVLALAVVQGVINAFDMPARQSFLIRMVEDRADLGNAIALNSSMVNGARLVGPALAGLIIGVFGAGWCFLLDGVSYLAVIASLLCMQLAPQPARKDTAGLLDQLREGWHYVRTFRPVRSILLLFALIGLMGYPFMVILPLVAGQVLHGDAGTLGWLTGASGLGAFISALSLALRRSVLGLTRLLAIAAAILGGALVCFGLSHSLWPALVCMLFTGFGLTQVMAITNTIIQPLVPEDKRARVMGYYTMAFFATMPLGSLLEGALAHRLGPGTTFVLTGACCLIGALWFVLERPRVKADMRPVYQAMGLLPCRCVQQVSKRPISRR